MKPIVRILIAGIAAAVLVAACSGDSDGESAAPGSSTTSQASPDGSDGPREVVLPDLTLTASLTPFDSCDALLGWIRDEAGARVGPYGLPGGYYGGPIAFAAEGDVTEEAAVDLAADDAAAPTGGDAGGVDFSTTNVQVEGVDEPDVVKTDGERIYALADGDLHVVDLTGSQPQLAGRVTLENGWGADMFLSGDTLLVLTREAWALPFAGEDLAAYGFAPEQPGSTLSLVDVSDPTNPVVTETLTVEGNVVSARMVDDVARVVITSQPQNSLGFLYPSFSSEEGEQRAAQVNREIVAESTLDDWLPSYVVTTADGTVTAEGRLSDCENVARPQQFSGFGMLSILTVDLSEGLGTGVSPDANTGVMSGGETVYASPEHLYVATTEYVDWEALDEQQRSTFDEDFGTAIHRFDISDPSATSYDGSGRVDGTLLNQFAMDEYDGVLRVASTAGSPWSEGQDTSQSFVTTLALDGDQLTERGRVGDLGRGETIHSVRFIGDRGYVVTFRQTDPLYTLDLSDAANPAVTGELKILGYSAYLHPVADGYLLGVGQDATEEGRTTGTQVSLFDVRDPANPTRVDQEALGSGSSAVEWDHRAFLWWAPDRLAMVPVETWEGEQFSGAYGFTVDPEAGTVDIRGQVENGPAVEPQGVLEPLPVEPDSGEAIEIAEELFEWTPPITRAVVVGDSVFTLSETGLLASDLASLSPQTWVAF